MLDETEKEDQAQEKENLDNNYNIMNKKQLSKIIDILFENKKQDDIRQEAYNNFFNIIAPYSYAPFIETKSDVMIELLKIIDPEVWDWTDYFLYEAEDFYPNCDIENNWKKYKIKNEQEAKDFIINLV